MGRTGFEPVTSSVSGNFRTIPGVCHRRTEFERGALTWVNILGGSGWAWGRLMALAPICGSHGFKSAQVFTVVPQRDRKRAPAGPRDQSLAHAYGESGSQNCRGL